MKYSIITYGSLSCVPREGLLPASFFQHLSVIGPPHYKKCLAIPCLTPPKPKKEKKLHKRTIISVTYCLSRAWKLACLPACLLPGAHLVTFFYHPTTAQRSPCQPQLVQFLLWKYKQDKKKCKWVLGRHEILHYHIWFPVLCATGGFASSILLSASLSHWPTTLQEMLGHPLSHTSQAQKGKKTSQKDHNKCNLLFVQGLKTCMFTCLSVAWGALSYIFLSPNHCPAFSLPATAGPIFTVEVQTGQEKM